MTSYSEYNGLVDFSAPIVASQQPVDVATTRDNLINNGAHLSQSSTQQRANWSSVVGRADNAAGGGTYPSLPLFFAGALEYGGAIPAVCAGPFPATVGPDGLPAKLVLRIGASVANGSGTVVAQVKAYRPRSLETSGLWDGTIGPPPSPGGPDVVEVSTASATPVWLTPSPTYVQLTDESEAAFARQRYSVPISAGGAPSYVTTVNLQICLWTQSTDPATPTVIHGLYCREFVG